ncbi:hypothetical protein K1718_27355 (plasmid) [Roseibium porphyridii]|uniref:ABC transporter permease n=1 Tax=Roseibium porphyridii TaxID=2866279 RepID=A0ABY8FBP1_9HYPH|nr:hypothetical protein [Roseibium sp. KMA01]WFE92646.1 hypothetical protein K1718_27355 [Roseibium sp. KMA01]
MLDQITNYIMALCAFVAPFSLMDNFLPERSKAKLSEYIFGFHGIKVVDFEKKMVRSWIKSFFKNGRIRRLRVIVFSIFSGIFVFVLMRYYFGVLDIGLSALTTDFKFIQPIADIHSWLAVTFVFVWIGTSTFVYDEINFRVSKIVYFGRTKRHSSIIQFILDLLLSMLASFIVSVTIIFISIYTGIMQNSENTIDQVAIFFWFGILVVGGPFSIVSFFFLRSIFFFSGISIRGILNLTNLNSYTALYTSAHNVPATFSSLVLFVTGSLVIALYNLITQ